MMIRLIKTVKEYWQIIFFAVTTTVGGVFWLQAQHRLLLENSESIEAIPGELRRLMVCHRHEAVTGEVYFTSCAIPGGRSAPPSPATRNKRSIIGERLTK